MWHLWSLQTPSGPADSLKTKIIRVYLCFYFGKDAPFLKNWLANNNSPC